MPTRPQLSFASTQTFRNTLIAKNLAPYSVPGTYTPLVSQVTYEPTISVYNVIDSPNNLIGQDVFANDNKVLNKFAPDSGYDINSWKYYNLNANTLTTNEGEYYQTNETRDTRLDIVNEFNINTAYNANTFGPIGGFNNMVIVTDIELPNSIHQPYWEPPSFEPSSYSPYSILLENNPTGTNGPLSEDSFIAKLGAENLKFAFQERVAAEIYKSTIGLVSLDSLKDPFEASLIISGKQPLIAKNYTITVPETPLARAGALALKLSGTYFPVSPIPGDYFEENTKGGVQTSQTSTALNVINSLTGGFLGPILNLRRNPSQIFIANTGNGQRSVLFNTLDYNRYQPAYDRTFGGILGIGQTLIQTALSLLSGGRGGYYVGSKNAEPSTITSPPNQIPVDQFGKQTQTPVYGPSELGILYEGNQSKINFGLAAKPSINAGGTSGSFVWTSPGRKNSAGYKATVGGGTGSIDGEYNEIKSNYTKGESTSIPFKKGSILDQTQRLINSADNVSGISKLKHVGNAINQVSKVFNDGYKEMTKGSQVVSYSDNATGQELGVEYCRVFTKDTPYYTYPDLQKSAGITKEGRGFSYSVLDNTYNLNIAPTKGEESTNIVRNNKGERYAKKYMFSLENLAWRTSSRPGYTYDDLPDCEKGPNGGRVMWFPPYDISFNDNSTANWNGTPFLGRPEQIFTYKDTTRIGSISWKIIVDSPSVLNLIADKQLKNTDPQKVDSILNSFFAGCVKYDLYTLAKKFNTFKMSELQELQEIITQPRLTKEDIDGVLKQIPKQSEVPSPKSGIEDRVIPTETPGSNTTEIESKFIDFGFYFEHDVPGPEDNTSTTSDDPFDVVYEKYVSNSNITKYENKSKGLFSANSPQKDTTDFFKNFVIANWETFTKGENSFLKQAEKILKEGNIIKVSLKGSASAKSTPDYNIALSKRRIDSVKQYFEKTVLSKYIKDGLFEITGEEGEGEGATIPKSEAGSGQEINCTTDIKDKDGVSSVSANIYARDAMACRRVRVSSVKVIKKTEPTPPKETVTTIIPQDTPGIEDPKYIVPPPLPPVIDVKKKLKDGIGKRILRRLLSECDYFEVIKKTSPFIYDSIREKIKYFNPAFHSMTPEGLNARLTFLNQCVRPGETIPVIGPDGKPKHNDALNTSFGAPPILVLRIGDFYHTKIIPRNLQISYDPLLFDLNPEGIGVQPMIAKVTLSFDFIGGHGLARPVEQLQNALSFNYYANTEIYDERAVWTEDTSKLDQQIFNEIFEKEIAAEQNQAKTKPERKGGKTIGDIATTVPVTDDNGTGETGFTTYQKIVDQTLSLSKQYFSDVYNTAKKISEQYNYGIWQLVISERQFTKGNFLLAKEDANVSPGTKEVEIFGSPTKFNDRLKFLSETVIEDIKTGVNNFIIKRMKELNIFKDADIERLRYNLEAYVANHLGNFDAAITTNVQEFDIFQQDMVQNFRKLNVVNSRTDGKMLDTGKPFVYAVDATNEVTQSTTIPTQSTLIELKNDYETLGIKYNDYIKFLKSADILLVREDYPKTKEGAGDFKPLSQKLNSSTIQDKRFYMVMCRIFSDKNKLTDFITFLLREGLKDINKFENKLEKVCNEFKDIVNEELKEQEKYFKKIKDKQEFINYQNSNSFPPNKVRKFKYTTIIPTDKKTEKENLVNNLWKDVNVNTDPKTWEGKVKFN